MAIELHQFPFSHYNDKVRWGLSHKNIEYNRISYLPGPHMRLIRKLTGQTSTPVLVWDEDVVSGSTDILRLLDKKVTKNPLFPTDPAQLERTEELLRYFDREVGPATRTLLFAILLNHGRYLTNMFSIGKSSIKRTLYGWTFPLVKGLMAKGNGVNRTNLERSMDIAHTAMAKVAAETQKTGYLVGDSFTVADLCAACLLAPLANPSHPDMARPRPMPEELQAFIDQFADHEAIVWTQNMYRAKREKS